jgi:hypothetical protein
MANDRSDRNSRIQYLLRLSDELKELSGLVERTVREGSREPADLLARNHDLVRRCDEIASRSSTR